MASNLRYFPTTEDVIIPPEADYEFPSVANKAIRISPRITPSNGNTAVLPGQSLQFTFPAQGFLDARKTTISFDLYLKGYDVYNPTEADSAGKTGTYCYLQNNVSSIFKHCKVSYGSYQVEQVQENGYLQRQLCEFSGYGAEDNDSEGLAKGIGGISSVWDPPTQTTYLSLNRARHHSLIYHPTRTNVSSRVVIRPSHVIINNENYSVKRYQIELPFGMMQQGKLVPVKYMASQLMMQFVLAPAAEVIMGNKNTSTVASPNQTGEPSYFIKNCVLHPELLEFDQTYEARFIRGLETGGIPIQFSTFKSYVQPLNSSLMSISIGEKSRSVKAIFAFIRKQQQSFSEDSGASFGDFEDNVLESFQYRVGGRYSPASPCMNTNISGYRTGSTEPFIELQKALKTLGDPTIRAAINPERWNAAHAILNAVDNTNGYPILNGASDGKLTYAGTSPTGFPAGDAILGLPGDLASNNLSSVFCMATALETSNGRELSGLNAEEQSDINLMIKWEKAPPTGYEVIIYTLCDKVMVVKENNYVDIDE